MSSRSTTGDLFHGAVAGAIGGLAAAWVMNQFMMHAQRRGEEAGNRSERQQARQTESSASSPQEQKKQKQQEEGGNGGGGDATVKTAAVISRNLFDHELTPQEKQIAGPAVHYAYGALVGSLY